jgi:hypothetical protein
VSDINKSKNGGRKRKKRERIEVEKNQHCFSHPRETMAHGFCPSTMSQKQQKKETSEERKSFITSLLSTHSKARERFKALLHVIENIIQKRCSEEEIKQRQIQTLECENASRQRAKGFQNGVG